MLYDEHHEIERLGRCIAIQTLILMQQKIDSIQFLTAKERLKTKTQKQPTFAFQNTSYFLSSVSS
jgi:hypothetical protein